MYIIYNMHIHAYICKYMCIHYYNLLYAICYTYAIYIYTSYIDNTGCMTQQLFVVHNRIPAKTGWCFAAERSFPDEKNI